MLSEFPNEVTLKAVLITEVIKNAVKSTKQSLLKKGFFLIVDSAVAMINSPITLTGS